MATQPQAPRQWFRLPSIARPAPPAAPTAEPSASQPRPPMVRAPFRPTGMPQPNQPQAYGVSSVPTSPIRRTSVPSSPVPRTSPSPNPQASSPSSSLPPSPSLKPPASPTEPSTSLMPTSPPKPAPTTFSVPSSPPKPAPTTFYVPNSLSKPKSTVTTTTRVPSPTPSSQTKKPADNTPPQSPYNKSTAPPPSPLILPPTQLKSKAELEPIIHAETEQKTVLVQTTSEKPNSWFKGTGNHKDFEETHKRSSYAHHGNHQVHKDVAKKEKGHRKKFSSDSDEVGVRVITIAGENKGAVMEVINSPLKHGFDGNFHTLRDNGNTKPDSDGTGRHSFSSSDEGKSKKDKNHKSKAMLSPPMRALMNSNVQSVNNSIVLHSSCSHHDPGVHLSLSSKPSGTGFPVKDKTMTITASENNLQGKEEN